MLSLFSGSRSKLIPCLNRIQTRGFFKVIPAYQKGVKLTLGKFSGVIEPGIRLAIPYIHQFHLVDIRDTVENLPKQNIISSNGVSYNIDASVQFKIVDSKKAVLNVSHVVGTVIERCKMELRTVLSTKDVNFVLKNRDVISNEVNTSLRDKLIEDWGIDLKTVQIRDISFDESLTRAMATPAEASRNAEAKIINADADLRTAELYSQAAKIYAENPITLRLREFQLWTNIAKDPASKIYVIPSNILDFVKESKQQPK